MRRSTSPRRFKLLYGSMLLTSRFSRRLSGAIAGRIWFTPWPVGVGERGKARQREWLEGTTPTTFETRHGRVTGFAAGEGPTVLLVHGWGDRAASMGAFVEPLVRSGRRVVAVDLPGHGSSVVIEPNVFVISDVLHDLAAELGGLNAIVAHSFGAQATMSALRDGLQAEALAFISPSSKLDSTLKVFTHMMKMPERARAGLVAYLERRFGADVWTYLSGTYMARGIETPALVVHDVGDESVPFVDSEELVEGWPSARLMETTGLGHGKTLRDSTVIEAVTEFIAHARDDENIHQVVSTGS